VDEYRDKTSIGLYTIPVKRWKILLTKLLVTISSSVIIAVTIFLLSIFVGWLVFGFDDFSTPHLMYSNGRVISTHVLSTGVMMLLCNTLSIGFACVLCILIGLLLKNSLVGAIFGLVIYFFGSLISVLVMGMDKSYEWIKYLPFLNMNFGYYFDNTFRLPSVMSIEFSAVMLVCYTIPIVVACFVINKFQRI
jgi:ABC-2 type transport system permease protein